MKAIVPIIGGVFGGTILYSCPYLIPPAVGVACLMAHRHNKKHGKAWIKTKNLNLKGLRHRHNYFLDGLKLMGVAALISLACALPAILLGFQGLVVVSAAAVVFLFWMLGSKVKA